MERRPGGRWCQGCKKTLIDFAGMTRTQAKARLKQVRGNEVYGRVEVHPDTGEVVFRPDSRRRLAGGAVLAAVLAAGCGHEEPVHIQSEIAAVDARPPMMPIDPSTTVMEPPPALVTQAIPTAELEHGPGSGTPTTEQRDLTDRKRFRHMVRGRMAF